MRRLFGALALLGMMLMPGAAQAASHARVLSEAQMEAQYGKLPNPPANAPRPVLSTPAQARAVQSGCKGCDTVDNRYLPYNGGPIMQSAKIYDIFWEPAHLQGGAVGGVAANFNADMAHYAQDVGGSSILGTQTQYWAYNSSGGRYFVQNSASYGGYVIDTSTYPKNVCYDASLGGWNCLDDRWIQYEVKKEMNLQGWTGGYGHMFMVYLDNGEGACDIAANSNGYCSPDASAYKGWCGYHYFVGGSSPAIIYAANVYGNSGCDGAPRNPSGNRYIDNTLSVTSHEHMEAVTDPIPYKVPGGKDWHAWYDYGSTATENGDKCAWDFRPIDYTNGNIIMNGRLYILQNEWSDNAFSAGNYACVHR